MTIRALETNPVSCLHTVGLTGFLAFSHYLLKCPVSEYLVLLLGFVLIIACYRREVGKCRKCPAILLSTKI